MNRITAIALFALVAIMVAPVAAEEGATVKGKVVFDANQMESWDNQKLKVTFEEIKSRLIESPKIPSAPIPENWAEMKPEDRFEWIQEFESSDEGKEFIADRKRILESRRAFDVNIEKNGDFVIFDVPSGVYSLEGRIDKKFGGASYGFEIFGQIEVLKDVDEIELDPIQVAVTPQLESGQQAPPIDVKTHDDEEVLTLDMFKGKYLFICFWISSSPSAEFQAKLQEMYVEMKDKQPLRMLAICVDEDRKQAVDYIVKQKLREGSRGFSDGLENRTLFDYGVRSFPSFWLIDPEGKIAMTQSEFAQAFRNEDDLAVIIANRIVGKDSPTPAKRPNAQDDNGASSGK